MTAAHKLRTLRALLADEELAPVEQAADYRLLMLVQARDYWHRVLAASMADSGRKGLQTPTSRYATAQRELSEIEPLIEELQATAAGLEVGVCKPVRKPRLTGAE